MPLKKKMFIILFSVLPKLMQQCSGRAIPLEDLLSEKGYDKILDFVPSLENIADLKVFIKYKDTTILSFISKTVYGSRKFS